MSEASHLVVRGQLNYTSLFTSHSKYVNSNFIHLYRFRFWTTGNKILPVNLWVLVFLQAFYDQACWRISVSETFSRVLYVEDQRTRPFSTFHAVASLAYCSEERRYLEGKAFLKRDISQLEKPQETHFKSSTAPNARKWILTFFSCK